MLYGNITNGRVEAPKVLTTKVIVHPCQRQHRHSLFHTANIQSSKEAKGNNQEQESAGLLTGESP